MDDFWFDDPDGKRWLAPAGSSINGASIPRPLWSTVGSPYTDDYRRASVVHDVACNDPAISRKAADVMFFHACRAGGCSPAKARMLYAGVRLGAWGNQALVGPPSPRDLLAGFKTLTRMAKIFGEEKPLCLINKTGAVRPLVFGRTWRGSQKGSS
ncbi:MAG: DUF1353 domain-containing protein, partial [Gammaproteobacteria bacterium]|nr:DUF1353 domain-containing protein [Gammaproteobacteria bacterium]